MKLWCDLPVIHQYSVFDEVEDVVKVGQVSDVDNLSSEEEKKEKRISKKLLFMKKCSVSESGLL